MNVVNEAIIVIINAIARNFSGIGPDRITDIRMSQVNTSIENCDDNWFAYWMFQNIVPTSESIDSL